MKKTLAAIAVLGAFAGSAVAADVTVYGKIDTGFAYTRVDNGQGTNTDTFEMASGINAGTRFGFKGTEDLGNGMKVGFVLENGFNSDAGNMTMNRLFGREAQINISGDFGTLALGRVGELASANGTFGLLGPKASALGNGWGPNNFVAGHTIVMAGPFDRYDNTITYVSPKFAGVNVYAQYSMDTDGADDLTAENESSVDRHYALGATYANGPVGAGLIVDYKNVKSVGVADVEDPIKVSGYASYDFGVAKVLAAAQYFKDSALKFSAINTTYGTANHDGFGINIGAHIPAFGGKTVVAVGYMDAETSASVDKEITRYTVTAAYEYPLSKRTLVYAGVSYTGDVYDAGDVKDANKVGAAFGIQHNF